MIKLENVSFCYDENGSGHTGRTGRTGETGGTEELRDINLHIRKGEFVLLCGGSGCGKTTLTRHINALIPHFYRGRLSGRVTIAGKNTAGIKPEELARLSGSVFQDPRSQFFNTDTTSEAAFGLENMGIPPEEIRRKVDKTVSALGIRHLMDRSIFELSGGEKQIVALASAYAPEPDIFVLDEPSSNLDRNSTRQLANALGVLKKEGKTIVVAEHRLYYLAGLFDRAVYMEHGMITHEWSRKELCSMPKAERESYGLRTLSQQELYPEQEQSGRFMEKIEKMEKVEKKISLRVSGLTAFHRQKKSFKPDVEFLGASGTQCRTRLCGAPLRSGRDAKHRVCSAPLQSFARFACSPRARPVVSGVSFEAAGGEVIGIVGSNGAGKSTLARTLCGLHKKSSGSVMVDGKLLSRSKRSGVFNMVMQESGYQLFTESVENELYMSARGGFGAKDVEALLETLALSEYRDRHPMSLSGGQKQRLAIGAVLVSGANIIIFDEPTSGLDFRNMQRVCEIFSFIREQGKIIFVITHDYELAMAVCTRLLYLEGGAIQADVPVNRENLEKMRNIFRLKTSPENECGQNSAVHCFA